MHTVPLPLALHLASYTVLGLFCMFAGGLNLIDPGHILRLGVPLLALAGFFAVGIDPFLSAAADQATTAPTTTAPAITVNRAMKGDRLPLVPPAAFTPDQGNRVVPQPQAR